MRKRTVATGVAVAAAGTMATVAVSRANHDSRLVRWAQGSDNGQAREIMDRYPQLKQHGTSLTQMARTVTKNEFRILRDLYRRQH